MAENINNNTNPDTNTSGGELPIETRIAQLQSALSEAKTSFSKMVCETRCLVVFFFILCVAGLVLTWFVVQRFINDVDHLPKDWTWQYGYVAAMRITAVSALFAVITFCFKTFKSYLTIYQQTREKYLVLLSLASLVESGANYAKREDIYGKLFAIITDFQNTDGNNSKDDLLLPQDAIKVIIESVADKLKKND